MRWMYRLSNWLFYKLYYIKKSCPNCGSSITRKVHIKSSRLPFWWYLECANCNWCGKTKLFLWRAIRAWNKGNSQL